MSDSVSLTNFESVMNAAKQEAESMDNESGAQVIESELKPQAELPKIPGGEVAKALNSTNVASVLNQMAANPDAMAKAMEESASQMTPEMLEEAKRLAMSGQGDQILKEMQRRGMDMNAIRSQMMEQKKMMHGLMPKTDDMKRVILITSNRQLKNRTVPLTGVASVAENILKSSKVVELACSRLAVKALQGKTIKVWCDPDNKGKNRRLSKILGFPMGGEGLIVMEEGDLDEKSFLDAEASL